MSFRSVTRYSLWLIVVISLLMASCAGENQPSSEIPRVALSKGSSECLSGFNKTLKVFIRGELSNERVNQFYNCVDKVVVTFLENTRGGSSGDAYTPAQIFTFLKQYFFGDLEVSAGMRLQIMHLKRVLVGGTVDSITRPQFEQVRAILDKLRGITLTMNAHVKVIYESFQSEGPSRSLTPDQLMVVSRDVDSALKILAGILAGAGENYSESHLKGFMVELYRFIYPDGENEKDWIRLLPLVWDIKDLIIGPFQLVNGERAFASHEWRPLFDLVSKILRSMARVWFFIVEGPPFGGPTSVTQLELIEIDIREALESAVLRHDNYGINFIYFDRVIDKLDAEFNFPIGLTGEGIKHLLRLLVQKTLTPLEVRTDDDQNDFRLRHVAQLSQIVKVWFDDQKASIEYSETRDLEKFRLSELGRVATESLYNFQLDSIGRISFVWRTDALEYDLNSLTQLGWKKLVVRAVLTTFAKEADRRDQLTFLNPDEMTEAQLELWPIGEGLDLWKRGETDLAKRVVTESNLFMPRADGDGNVGFVEGVEYFAFVMSGLAAKDHLRDLLVKDCPLVEIDEITDGFNARCFKRKTHQYLDQILEHTPYLLRYLKKEGSDKLWREFVAALQGTAVGREVDIFSQGDVMIMWILIQYIETFFARFDIAEPIGEVNLSDARVAYQIYGPYLESLLAEYDLTRHARWSLFTYLLKFGSIPFLEDGIGGGVRFIWWKLREDEWELSADRLRIVKILAALNQQQGGLFGYPIPPAN